MSQEERRNKILLKTNNLIDIDKKFINIINNNDVIIEYQSKDLIILDDITFNNINYIIFKINPMYKQIKKSNYITHIITNKYNYKIYYLLYDNINYYLSSNYIDKNLYEVYINCFNELCDYNKDKDINKLL